MNDAIDDLPGNLAWINSKQWQGCLYSSGWHPAPQVRDVIEPATGAVLGRIGIAGPKEVGEAATVASAAQLGWAATRYEERAAVLRRAAANAEANSASLVDWLIRESGSIRAKAEFEVAVTIKAMHLAAAMPLQSTGQILPSQSGRLSIARRVPVGVVGVISPFNFPLYLAMRAIAPALAVGNAVLVKPDPRTAVSGGILIARLFESSGLPAGILHVLPGDADAGESLCANPRVAMIQFTGSTRAGRAVGRAAGENLKKVSLELGGKNALIILDDAPMDLAIANARWSVYLHQGQICMSAGRILVHRKIAAEFSRRMAEAAHATPVGNPATEQVALGPMISAAQVNHALGIVRRTVEQGATLLAGGASKDLFFQPTVLSGVRQGMSAFEEEIFAPVAAIVTFDEDAEAVRLANDTEFGLSAAIISHSTGRALAMGERLNVGLLHINDQTVNDDVVNPFGGVGASGNGSSIGGPANWEQFTRWQWLTLQSSPPPYPL